MLPQVVVWWLDGSYDIAAISCIRMVSGSIVNVLDIILIVLLGILTIVLIFKYLGENTFCIGIALINRSSVPLNTHTSSMDSVELVLYIIRCSWGSLTTLSCWWTTTTIGSLRNSSCNIYFVTTSSNEVLSLVTARLDYKTLFVCAWHITSNLTCINWLPSILSIVTLTKLISVCSISTSLVRILLIN